MPGHRSYEQRKMLEGYYFRNISAAEEGDKFGSACEVCPSARHHLPVLERVQRAVAQVGEAGLGEADLMGPEQEELVGLKPRLGRWRMESALGFVVIMGQTMKIIGAEAPAVFCGYVVL